ncbi:hypothetical protein [Streptomyces sp. NPDC047718]|uniref:hypothetical protein n=1 Tax=Streptomyces sp. NPDC047718 TaxID=3155479 RepID=UPI0034063F4F
MDLIYDRCVQVALDDPKINRLLGKRPGATWERAQQKMRAPRYVLLVTTRCNGATRQALDKAREDLQRVERKHRSAAESTEWHWLATCLLTGIGVLTALISGGVLALGAAGLIAGGVMLFLWRRRGTPVWSNMRYSLTAGGWGISWILHRVDLGLCAARWGEVLRVEGTRPVVAQLVQHLLGDDPDSLFISDGQDGLRTRRAPDHIVESAAMRQLQRKLALIEDGTIAVCGPRGSGKTTLLEQCVEQANFGLIAQAPATYTPHDFLLSMSVRLCEKYIDSEGYEVPKFTRPSPFQRLLSRVRSRAARLGRWSAFALPAAALLVLGMSAPARSLYEQHASFVAGLAHRYGLLVRDHAVQVWQGHTVGASVTVTIAGIVWWKSRRARWLPPLVARTCRWCTIPLGIGLIVLSITNTLMDKQLLELARRVPPGVHLRLGLLALLWLLCAKARDSGIAFPLGRLHISFRKIFRPGTAAAMVVFLWFLVRTPQTYALLSDAENPLRLAGIVAGILLARVGHWRPRPAEPALVTECRSHLYRLQTVQTATHALNTGASQILTLGSSHTTSISTVPPTYPALVEEFRRLLGRIAEQKAAAKETVVIAIDEVDRLGSDAQALAFLGEIKAILGVPHVYYLISVAEDVGAAFVRRGLPHRDVTDSSLDDIIHVQPSTLKESQEILAKRSEILAEPYAALAHALSGGILRDLLRYGIQIKEMHDKAGSFELTDISQHLILEELSETLAGFRTLLSKRQWTRDTSGILSAFRTLGGYLRELCSCAEAPLRRSLEEFAFYAAGDQPRPIAHDELADDARHLIDEAAAYAYFSLTLLNIFSTTGLNRRTQQAADNGPDGDLERLAEARQELAISPYSARPLIDNIRKAWSLPLGPTTNIHILRPRSGNCSIHGEEPS